MEKDRQREKIQWAQDRKIEWEGEGEGEWEWEGV